MLKRLKRWFDDVCPTAFGGEIFPSAPYFIVDQELVFEIALTVFGIEYPEFGVFILHRHTFSPIQSTSSPSNVKYVAKADIHFGYYFG
jgi:hypothetical protein